MTLSRTVTILGIVVVAVIALILVAQSVQHISESARLGDQAEQEQALADQQQAKNQALEQQLRSELGSNYVE